jgi:glutamate-1-semialdehyde 2,1-aminomutase
MSQILQEYQANHTVSAAIFEKSRRVFPDGVTHDGRYLDPFPVYMAEGTGSRKSDVDGNSYIDFVMGHGALILGHSHPAIVDAVTKQVCRGTHLGANTELELEWAEKVKSLVPTVEKVRFHSSGTEAVAMAIRLARAYTGRSAIIKFNRHFHGWSDAVVTDPGRYSASGIPPGTRDSALIIQPNDVSALEDYVSRQKVAAIILEPTGGQMGKFPLAAGFLQKVRDIASSCGAVLIFDEVVTGFRVSTGGAQKLYGIAPDLSTFGKILGGGLPGAASAGKSEIMDMIAHRADAHWNENDRVGHPGTFNANPLSAAAGVACLNLIQRGDLNEAADLGAIRLKAGLNQTLEDEKVAGFAYGASSIVYVAIGITSPGPDVELSGYHDELASDNNPDLARFFKLTMLNNGVDTMSGKRFIVSAAHTDVEIDTTIEAFGKSIREMKHEQVFG